MAFLLDILSNSFLIKTMLNINAMVSDTGATSITPSIPRIVGKISISGIRKMACRERESIIPLNDFPMAEKKFEDINYTSLMMTINKNVRINFTANSMYNSLSPEHKIAMIYLGKTETLQIQWLIQRKSI